MFKCLASFNDNNFLQIKSPTPQANFKRFFLYTAADFVLKTFYGLHKWLFITEIN